MYQITINIISGSPSFTIYVIENEIVIDTIVVPNVGQHVINLSGAGEYDIRVVDSLNCEAELLGIIVPTTTTTSSSTTTTSTTSSTTTTTSSSSSTTTSTSSSTTSTTTAAEGCDIMTGLLGVWELDETSGTTAYDSYNDYDGNIIGSTLVGQTGKINKCVSYDGNGDYIDLSSHLASFSSNIGTISVWVYYSGTNCIPFGTGDTYRTYMILQVSTTNHCVDFAWRQSAGTENRIRTVASISTGWHHLVVTSNGSTWKIYIDGNLATVNVVSGSNNGNWISDLTGNTYLHFGAFYYSYALQYSNCKQDQTAIWNIELSADQIQCLYNSGDGLPLGVGWMKSATITTTTTTTTI